MRIPTRERERESGAESPEQEELAKVKGKRRPFEGGTEQREPTHTHSQNDDLGCAKCIQNHTI